MKDNKTVAIVPGSFDPITYGHIDIIRRAAEMYDIVYVAVMINDQKKYLFSLEERERIATLAVENIKNVSVISSSGMLWRLAQELYADALVKGYRNNTDYEYEQKMAKFNFMHNPNAKTVLLQANQNLEALSSTLVREKLANGVAIDGLLPAQALDEVKKILNSRK